jgi:ppGpp synthetase/RelA/SpoT-type nucleotidyltranferase
VKVEKSIRDHYVALEDVYRLISSDVDDLLKEACEKNGWIYNSRIKESQSYALKLATGREIDDFLGCSIVVPTLGEVPEVVDLVESCLVVVDKKPKETIRHRPTEFQFDSLRLYCQLKGSVNPAPKHDLKFEIQVKTLLEQAWSQATHDFSYKGSDISWAKERIAAQLKAMLDNVELSISQITMLSSSPNLDRKHQDYESRATLLAYLRDELGGNSGVILPADLRRLTDIVHGLLKFMNAGLDDLRQWVVDETALGRGTQVTDLSAYSMILQSAMNQNPAGFVAGLNETKNRQRIFVTDEVTVPAAIDLGKNPKIVRIPQPVRETLQKASVKKGFGEDTHLA